MLVSLRRRMPLVACAHGIVSIDVVATQEIAAQGPSVKPVPLSIARAPARSRPSVTAVVRRLAGLADARMGSVS
jgi:uncharacterized lipoprotein YajG